jgi:hypothetical protein
MQITAGSAGAVRPTGARRQGLIWGVEGAVALPSGLS